MHTTLLQFPGSNRDRDMIAALTKISGVVPHTIWHTETELPDTDLIVIPGGFSYGDYLRAGAIAARSPIMNALRKAADGGVPVLGVCNGFQILTEAGLLPGALMRNAGLNFVCKTVQLQVDNANSAFTRHYDSKQIINCPVAHHDGNFFAQTDELAALEDNGQVVFRYTPASNPNGSINDIAGIVNAAGNVLGMMPHPENLIEDAHGGKDGKAIFTSILNIMESEAA